MLLLKYWFHLSKPQQRKRLEALEADPRTRWRVGEKEWSYFRQYDRFVEVCEPFLVRAGMIARTPRGRVATPLAWTHLGMVPPPRASGLGQPGLFE